MSPASPVESFLLPKELFGTHKEAKAFASRFAKKLFRSESPTAVMEEVECVEVGLRKDDRLLMQFAPGLAMLLPVGSNEPLWRLYAIGPAVTYIVDRMSGVGDPLERLDSTLLSGMQTLWFTLATLNPDWTYPWMPGWRKFGEERKAASLYLDRYLEFLPRIQAISPFLSYPFHSSVAGDLEEGRHPWALNILAAANHARDSMELNVLNLSKADGNIVKLFQSAGIVDGED